MSEFLAASAAAILLFVAIGLYRLLRGPSRIDRVAAMQLVERGTLDRCQLGAFGDGTRLAVR